MAPGRGPPPVPNWIYREAQQRATAAPGLETPAMKQSKSGLDSVTPRPWTFEEAQAAVPYFSSVARSLRDHYLEILAKRRAVQLLRERHGRPDRKALIEEQEARRDLQKAELAYQEAFEELTKLNVQPLDPGQGMALVPFVHDGELAWYVFDLFDRQAIRSWRCQNYPQETRRPLTAP